MSSLQEASGKNSSYTQEDRDLLLNTIEVLDEEKENILTEVLRCYVCFELPKGKQVKICVEGHHFCFTCHNKINCCGICRGKLLESRNFVVEQLVAKLGPILEISKNELPPAKPPMNFTRGYYRCLHQCHIRVPAFQMLPHLRSKHPTNLLENVRSNSYFGCFSLKLKVQFAQDKKYIWSTHVSDMGLFTTELDFFGLDFFGCVRMLADETVASQFRYQLVLKVPNGNSESLLEFSMTNCPVSSYLDDIEVIKERKNCLRVMGTHLLDYISVGSVVTVFFSIWEKRENFVRRERSGPSLVCVPERDLHFENNRRTRRNRNRNMRRHRLKVLRNTARNDELVEGLSSLTL